jgi:hypothetical protein
LADNIFVAHAEPGGKTEQLIRQVLTWGKLLWTLDSGENLALVAAGARPLKPESIVELAGRVTVRT